MDDLQFRRAIYSDPNNQDADIIAAQQQDPSKKKFAKDICQLDDKIKQALQVPVPDDLYNKLILRQTLASHQVQKRKKRLHLAIAASVAIIGGLLINALQFSSSYTSLADYALAHVNHEQGLLKNNDGEAIDLSVLNNKMTSFDGAFSRSLGKLLFVDYCRFDGMKSLHLVFQGKTSPVTIFVVPKNNQLSFNSTFHDKQFFGGALAFNKNNIIVVADKNESLSQWQQNINDTVTWSI
ncbi:DUF3379 family protein [Colwellia echini]|uniref:DUF3379 domain-containing protein n=1 Tax=Colwellia echini TaxID=1982103 RepID=A0ABY3MT36_9GAMM|nr:DUF3379 family protein [Colwellia echini]TYK64299.1 DUF3379 domain-containing protein [Colwellia echini]